MVARRWRQRRLRTIHHEIRALIFWNTEKNIELNQKQLRKRLPLLNEADAKRVLKCHEQELTSKLDFQYLSFSATEESTISSVWQLSTGKRALPGTYIGMFGRKREKKTKKTFSSQEISLAQQTNIFFNRGSFIWVRAHRTRGIRRVYCDSLRDITTIGGSDAFADFGFPKSGRQQNTAVSPSRFRLDILEIRSEAKKACQLTVSIAPGEE